MMWLSKDIRKIKIGKRVLLKLAENLKNSFFPCIFRPLISHLIISFKQQNFVDI